MKKIVTFLLILFPLIYFSQNWKIPELDWQDTANTENDCWDLLKLKDRNSLIVKIGYSSYWYQGLNAEYFVYQNDGTVKHFTVFEPNSNDLKAKVKQKRIKKEKSGLLGLFI